MHGRSCAERKRLCVVVERQLHRQLTSIDVLLELRRDSTSGVVEFEKESYPHQRRVLLDKLRYVHLGLVAQHVRRQLHRQRKQKENDVITRRRIERRRRRYTWLEARNSSMLF